MNNIQEQINHNFVSPLYFAQIPNIAVIDLTPNEYILYGAYLRTIWNSENGSCWKSQNTLAKEIGYSIPTLRKAREGLASKGYISVESRKNEGDTDVITLLNKWQENIERQGGLKDSLQGVEKSFAPPSKDSLHKEEKENKKKEERENIPLSQPRQEHSYAQFVDSHIPHHHPEWTPTQWIGGNKPFTITGRPKYADGKHVDPLLHSLNVSAVFYAWLRALEWQAVRPAETLTDLWRDNYKQCEQLVLHRITPYEVCCYVYEQYQDGFWQGKVVSVENIQKQIQAWKTKKAQATDAPPIVPVPDSAIKPQEFGRW